MLFLTVSELHLHSSNSDFFKAFFQTGLSAVDLQDQIVTFQQQFSGKSPLSCEINQILLHIFPSVTFSTIPATQGADPKVMHANR